MMKKSQWIIAALLILELPAFASQSLSQMRAVNQAVDRITAREAENLKALQNYAPMVETYIQTFSLDKDMGQVPNGDRYFLGRASFKGHIQDSDFLGNESESLTHKTLLQLDEFALKRHIGWVSLGFAQMAVIDAKGFDHQHYNFVFQRREFLGEVRTLVFDVMPKPHAGYGRFLGRIWVEDQGYNIVRFNGTYIRPRDHVSYVHFDSWRVNVAPGRWLPAYIYGEEPAIKVNGHTAGFRSQTRLWGYSASGRTQNEFTEVVVDSKDLVNDQTGRAGLSPVASERNWERQAEDNELDRLEQVGILAPPSDIDKILETVVNNILVTNDLDIEVRCRVLLTAPIESFTVGHTIVLSRGLIDVLPDEASLAAVLAHELSHILLGHGVDTRFGFADRLLFPDNQTLEHLAMLRTPDEEAAADKRSIELIAKSPYAGKLDGTGLFMKQLAEMHSVLPNLIRGRMGNSMVDDKAMRLASIVAEAPKLNKLDLKQVAALPLGARVLIDPWNNHIEMSKAKTVEILSPREKMPFQIAPFSPYLFRVEKDSHTSAPSEAVSDGTK